MKKHFVSFISKIPFVQNYFSGIATIFMLHRVAPFEKEKLFPNENMKVSPEFLEKFIIELKNNSYIFIDLNELCEMLQTRKKIKKCIVFTLDDGYKDNYEIAYPIFKKHNVPFTVYVATSFPNQNALLWWYALEDLIIQNDELLVEKQRYNCKTYKEKNKVFLNIRREILKLEQKNLQVELNRLFKKYEIDWFSKNKILCMNWKEIVEMSQDKLCTIAGHTRNHYAFNRLDKDEIIKEITQASKETEEKIGKKIEHFAYPFGNVSEVGREEMEIVKELGFKTATTTRRGNIYLEHKEFANCCLPRIMLEENFKLKDIGKIRKKRIRIV